MTINVLALLAVLTLSATAQQTTPAVEPEVAVLKAGLGPCSADFAIKDADDKPVYAAAIHVRIRYGLWGVKRMDLEVGTNERGLARIEGLPAKARLLVYDIQKNGLKASIEQNVADSCHARYERTIR